MFTTTPVVRGFTEIALLYKSIQKFNGMICGGYARYCASLRKNAIPATDVDVFFKTPEEYELAKASFLADGLEIKHENEVSLTFKVPEDPKNYWRTTPPIQLIKPMKEARLLTYGEREEILEYFDFTIVRAAIVDENTVLVDEDFEKDELATNLRIKNIHCPISSLFRAIKYIRRGYFLSPVESIKLFIDWQERDQEYRNKVLSFLERIEKFKENGESTLSQEEIDEFERLMRID
jgi:hypothetical protein